MQRPFCPRIAGSIEQISFLSFEETGANKDGCCTRQGSKKGNLSLIPRYAASTLMLNKTTMTYLKQAVFLWRQSNLMRNLNWVKGENTVGKYYTETVLTISFKKEKKTVLTLKSLSPVQDFTLQT